MVGFKDSGSDFHLRRWQINTCKQLKHGLFGALMTSDNENVIIGQKSHLSRLGQALLDQIDQYGKVWLGDTDLGAFQATVAVYADANTPEVTNAVVHLNLVAFQHFGYHLGQFVGARHGWQRASHLLPCL